MGPGAGGEAAGFKPIRDHAIRPSGHLGQRQQGQGVARGGGVQHQMVVVAPDPLGQPGQLFQQRGVGHARNWFEVPNSGQITIPPAPSGAAPKAMARQKPSATSVAPRRSSTKHS